MAKFLYSAAMSLDGFITGPGGDMSWLAEHIGPNPVVDELITQVGAILAGRRTYGGDDPYKGQPGEGEAFGGGWDGPQFVLTHRPPADPVAGVTFVGDLESALAESRRRGRQIRQRARCQCGRAVPGGRSAGRGAGMRDAGAARRRHPAV